VAGEDEVSLSNAGKSFTVNLASLHEIRLDPFDISTETFIYLHSILARQIQYSSVHTVCLFEGYDGSTRTVQCLIF